MAFFGFLIAFWLFFKFKRHWRYYRARLGEDGVTSTGSWGCGPGAWDHEWSRHQRHWQRDWWREERRRRTAASPLPLPPPHAGEG